MGCSARTSSDSQQDTRHPPAAPKQQGCDAPVGPHLRRPTSAAKPLCRRRCPHAGDINGSGSVFFETLVFLACADPSDLVALEAIRALFGAPYPRAEPLRKRCAHATLAGGLASLARAQAEPSLPCDGAASAEPPAC